jgi:glutathione S-transferase
MRARIALAYAGQRCVMREVSLRDKPAAMLEASPKGTVPTLVLPDGTVIDESLDVMQWAIAQNDPDNWGEAMMHPLLGEPFEMFLKNNRIFKYKEDTPEWAPARDACVAYMAQLDAAMQAGGFLTGDCCRFADVRCFPLIRQFSKVDPDWFAALGLTALSHWLETMIAMPCFEKAMHKYPVWQAEDAPQFFPI